MDRRKFLGGSDMSDMLSVDWGCVRKLYLQKRGVKPDFPFFGNRATERGHALEDDAAELYASLTGRQIRRAPWRKHPDFPNYGCHADYEIINHSKGPAPLSIKVPGRESYYAMKDRSAPDLGYIAQVQWEMFIWNRQWASFAILWADGWQLKSWDIDRDDEMILNLVSLAQKTWKDIVEGNEPAKLPATDRRCKGCGYRVQCHSSSMLALLEAELPAAKAEYDPSLQPLVASVWDAQELYGEAEKLLTNAKDRLRDALGDNSIVETDVALIYHKLFPGRKTFQADAFFRQHKELAGEREKFTNNGKPYRVLTTFEKGANKKL